LGEYTLYAQAEDSYGVLGYLAPLTPTVQSGNPNHRSHSNRNGV
jgi:hypothetical protein